MGIGNTTPATCLACCLTGGDAGRRSPGPGTGLDAAGVRHKAAVVERALALHAPAIADPVDALARLGGGEIAVLCGLALGAGEHGLGYVCDGLIATAAAAVAAGARARRCGRACSPATARRSPPTARLLDHLGLRPVLDLDMRLGEASGAVAALADPAARGRRARRHAHVRRGRRLRRPVSVASGGERRDARAEHVATRRRDDGAMRHMAGAAKGPETRGGFAQETFRRPIRAPYSG